MVKRGPEAGKAAVSKLEALIEKLEAQGGSLPMNGPALHLSEICKKVGVGRATVHQNPAFEARLRAYAKEKGVSFSAKEIPGSQERQTEITPDQPAPTDTVPASQLRLAERRISMLEKRLSELTARNVALTAELRQAKQSEEILLTRGRRLRPSGSEQMANIAPED